jgi:hypothetical protein
MSISIIHSVVIHENDNNACKYDEMCDSDDTNTCRGRLLFLDYHTDR